MNVARNAPCPCGSGKKFKKCCLPKQPPPVRTPQVKAPPEDHFTTEIRPALDKAADHLLERLEAGEGKGLEADFQAFYERAPNYHMTNYAMGVFVAKVKQDSAGAIPFFEQAVRIFPPFTEAHYNLGSACFGALRLPECVAAFRKAIRYSDGEDGIDVLARKQLNDLERIVCANSPFQNLDAYLQNQALFDDAFERLRQKDYESAARMFRQVLEQNPRHPQSFGNLALAEAGLGHKTAALACLDQALAVDPSYEPARLNRKAIEAMTEGQPQGPCDVLETEYYRERLEKKQPRTAGKFMRKLLSAFSSLLLLASIASAADSPATALSKTRVMVFTGGHGFEKEPFFKLFKENADITFQAVEHPNAYPSLTPDAAKQWDVLVLYDMQQDIPEAAKQDFLARLEEGKGLVVLHHALCWYQHWPEYAKIIGGQYFLDKTVLDGVEHPPSTYKHDMDFKIHVADTNHPVTRGITDYETHDETYFGFGVNSDCHPLLTTYEPTSTKVIAWTKTYAAARVVYIQSGHDHRGYENPNFQRLLRQAIQWTAKKDQ